MLLFVGSTWERTEESTSIINLFAIVLSLFLWPPEVFPFQCHHLLFHSFVEYILLFSIPLLPPFNFDYLYLMSIISPFSKFCIPCFFLMVLILKHVQVCIFLMDWTIGNLGTFTFYIFLLGFFFFRK